MVERGEVQNNHWQDVLSEAVPFNETSDFIRFWHNMNRKTLLHGTVMGGLIVAASAIAPQAQAAEQITLSYQGSDVDVTRNELESFTETGTLPPSIQSLLGTDAQVPIAIRTLLNQEIKVPAFVDKFLNSATGEFVLGQLDDTISSTSGRTEQDLFDLKAAFNSAANDQRLSFMELVRRYPQRNVRVNLSSLEGTYNRVSNFVERVQPALEIAKGFLSDIICDCGTVSVAPTGVETATTGDTLYASSDKPCNQAQETTLAEDSPTSQPVKAGEPAQTDEVIQVGQSLQ